MYPTAHQILTKVFHRPTIIIITNLKTHKVHLLSIMMLIATFISCNQTKNNVAISTTDTTKKENNVLIDNASDSLLPPNRKEIKKRCTHEYTNLSKKYNYKVSILKILGNEIAEAIEITVTIISKKDKSSKEITLIPTTALVYNDCEYEAVTSCITNVFPPKIINNDFGNFVVADLNFDSLEDIGIKDDNMGYGGARYVYYIQDTLGNFKKHAFLTNEMAYFPVEINPKNKTLITNILASNGYNENIFQYNPQTKKWKYVKQNYVGN